MAEPEMAQIAELITRVLRAPSEESVIAEVRGDVELLCSKFTPYPV
jgi:glycine/serine hydroxymethyltransferase